LAELIINFLLASDFKTVLLKLIRILYSHFSGILITSQINNNIHLNNLDVIYIYIYIYIYLFVIHDVVKIDANIFDILMLPLLPLLP
jgi:hypothetical protein